MCVSTKWWSNRFLIYKEKDERETTKKAEANVVILQKRGRFFPYYIFFLNKDYFQVPHNNVKINV